MSVQPDSDRAIAAWLELMPSEAPERVVVAVVEAVATTPQLAPRTPRAAWRSLPMRRVASVGGAAAAIVGAIAIAASGLGGRLFGTGATPPPTLGPTPLVTAAPPVLSPVPEALHGRWLGGGNGVVDQHPELHLVLDAETVRLRDARRQDGAASAAFVGIYRIQVSALGALPAGLCTSGLLGEYSVRLSPEGKALTFEAIRDDCPASATTLAGTWWRSDCRPAEALCLGPLEAGRYASLYLRPVLPGAGGWWTDAKFGELEYTVPSGWANYGEDNWTVRLALAEDYREAPLDGNNLARPEARLIVYARVAAVPDGCVAMDPPRALDAEGFVAWLRNVPHLLTTDPQPFTVDGIVGLSVDIEVAAGPAPPCRDGPEIAYLQAGGDRWAEWAQTSILPGERRRLVVLSLDAHNLAVISMEVDDASRFEAFVTEALPIIESMHFR